MLVLARFSSPLSLAGLPDVPDRETVKRKAQSDSGSVAPSSKRARRDGERTGGEPDAEHAGSAVKRTVNGRRTGP